MIEVVERTEVRTFTTLSEIEQLPGYIPNNPVNASRYRRLIGDYHFPEEIPCCLQKPNGNLCAEPHKHGFVALLADDTVTVLGNCCARDKFNATVRADRARYLNEQRRIDKLRALEKLLAGKLRSLQDLNNFKEKLKVLKNGVDDFLSELGQKTRKALDDMSKTSNSNVAVRIVNLKKYIDENGEEKVEKVVTKSNVGSFVDISVINKTTFQAIFADIRSIEAAYEEAKLLTSDSKTSAIERAVAAISNDKRVLLKFDELKMRCERFIKNDFSLLCFLTDDKVERVNSAKFAMQRLGLTTSKEKAKLWLSEKDQNLKVQLKADRIEI